MAIKLLSHPLAASSVARGFLAERRILARLEHPNIARLLDAGLTPGGHPYLAMEWVDGESLTRFCDANRLDLRARLDLLARVCDAVEYAHQRLVVHRDLKPSNVMVTRDGTPKLLDFGIAKVLEEEAGDGSPTHTVGRFMTPQYASPEQIRGEPIGTSTDVYSLGVLLYELLAGRPPHVVDTRTPFEAGRAVLEEKAAPLPRAIEGEDAPEIARRRSTTPGRLRQALSGDLETIVAQAMHKDPARRYRSVGALGDDVRRHLRGDAVAARGDSLGYRTGRFVRRNRLPLGLASVAVVGAAAFAIFHTQRVAAERDRARTEAETAAGIADFLVGVFAASDPDAPAGADLTAQDLLARGAQRVREELADDPVVRARLLDVLGSVQAKRGRARDALPLLEEALALRRETLGDDHVDVVQSLTHLATVQADLSHWEEAARLAQEAYDLSARILGPRDPDTIYRLHNLGVMVQRTGDLERAEGILRESLAGRRRLVGDAHAGTANALATLAGLVRDRGRHDEAAGLFEEALALSRTVYGDDHPRVASVWNNMARLYARLHRWDDAERCAREALRIRRAVYGERNVRVAPPLGNVAVLQYERGRFAEADSLYREVSAILHEAYGPDHREHIGVLRNLGLTRDRLGRTAEAESLLAASVELAERVAGPRNAETARSRHELGSFLARRGRPDEAIRHLAVALEVHRDAQGEDHDRTRRAHIALADALRRGGDPAGCRRELLAVSGAVAPDPDAEDGGEPLAAELDLAWARLAADERDPDTARRRYAAALAAYEERIPPGHPRLAELRAEIAALAGS